MCVSCGERDTIKKLIHTHPSGPRLLAFLRPRCTPWATRGKSHAKGHDTHLESTGGPRFKGRRDILPRLHLPFPNENTAWKPGLNHVPHRLWGCRGRPRDPRGPHGMRHQATRTRVHGHPQRKAFIPKHMLQKYIKHFYWEFTEHVQKSPVDHQEKGISASDLMGKEGGGTEACTVLALPPPASRKEPPPLPGRSLPPTPGEAAISSASSGNSETSNGILGLIVRGTTVTPSRRRVHIVPSSGTNWGKR